VEAGNTAGEGKPEMRLMGIGHGIVDRLIGVRRAGVVGLVLGGSIAVVGWELVAEAWSSTLMLDGQRQRELALRSSSRYLGVGIVVVGLVCLD
jgi:hypothetical protein